VAPGKCNSPEKINASQEFELLAPVHSNVVCFGLKPSRPIDEWINKVNNDGKVVVKTSANKMGSSI
jgi:hypothetical protein